MQAIFALCAICIKRTALFVHIYKSICEILTSSKICDIIKSSKGSSSPPTRAVCTHRQDSSCKCSVRTNHKDDNETFSVSVR